MVQQIIIILLGIYLLGEAISAAALMEGGDKLSRLGKYLMVVICALWLIFESNHVDFMHLAMAFTLALFLWPKMLKRIDHMFNVLIGD